MIPNGQDAGRGRCDTSDYDAVTDERGACSKHHLKDTEYPSNSRLENLPPELRLLVLLSMPDLLTLRALVRASRVLYVQYQHYRDTVLRACLSHEMDGFLVDAYVTAMYRVRNLRPRTNETITDYLNTYRRWLSSSTPFPDMKLIAPDCIRWMATYHISVVLPLARLYSNWALTKLKKATLPSTSQQGAIAATEVIGVLNEEIEGPAAQPITTFLAKTKANARVHFLPMRFMRYSSVFSFNPWESEAIGCIEIFVRFRYDDIFDQVKRDLHLRNPSFRIEHAAFGPGGSHDQRREYSDYLDGAVSRGLKIAARLFAIDDHEKLVSEMEQCVTHFRELDAPMGQALGTVAQYDRRVMSINSLTPQDEEEQIHHPIEFSDDVPPNAPPFAWVALWGGKYSNIYGDYVPASVRILGYVMWDKGRWIDVGVDEHFITAQWKTVPDLVEMIEDDYHWMPIEHQRRS
ncbi:hypothetical protein F4859DRAFT_521094 [Xylaria cf. heliscus]|nr:hypothetical protein F4859DRAFT_521094 [Xylaria cf. heliscus]